jgi:hypothetical protein
VSERYIKQAYPHESGHILVGRLLGLKVSGLAHEVIRGRDNEILPGNLVTASMAPPSPEVVRMSPPAVLRAYAFFVSGGLAENLVANIPADDYGLRKDRADLALVSTNSLEEVARVRSGFGTQLRMATVGNDKPRKTDLRTVSSKANLRSGSNSAEARSQSPLHTLSLC